MNIMIIKCTSINNYSDLFYLLGIPMLLGYLVIKTYGKSIYEVLKQLTAAYPEGRQGMFYGELKTFLILLQINSLLHIAEQII